jgi:hypothetical protein
MSLKNAGAFANAQHYFGGFSARPKEPQQNNRTHQASIARTHAARHIGQPTKMIDRVVEMKKGKLAEP